MSNLVIALEVINIYYLYKIMGFIVAFSQMHTNVIRQYLLSSSTLCLFSLILLLLESQDLDNYCRLVLSSGSSCPVFQVLGFIGVCHHSIAHMCVYILYHNISYSL